MSIIPELRRLKQENHEFKASLGYIFRLCVQKEKIRRVSRHEWSTCDSSAQFPKSSLKPRTLP
jgi:hypothetical protein